MKEGEKIVFSTKDLACEAVLLLLREGDLAGAMEILSSGIAYNLVKDGGDPEKICRAWEALHPELKLFKKNFLNRGKGHW